MYADISSETKHTIILIHELTSEINGVENEIKIITGDNNSSILNMQKSTIIYELCSSLKSLISINNFFEKFFACTSFFYISIWVTKWGIAYMDK